MFSSFQSFLCFTALGLLICGCASESLEAPPEKSEKHYLRGTSLMREGREEEALSAFLRVIEKRPDAAKSHLKAGEIYLNHIEDPIAAIYHFRRYLELKPKSPKAGLVRQLIETGKKKFALSLPAEPFEDNLERLDLMELINNVKSENFHLKMKIRRLEQQIEEMGAEDRGALSVGAGVNEHVNPSPIETPLDDQPGAMQAGSRPEFYIVQPGDNLNRISMKVYGTPARWMEIFQANRDHLVSPHDLKVGDEIRLP